MIETSLDAEKHHLAELLEVIQRCVYFLYASRQKILWPLMADHLAAERKNITFFETLAAINERFAKLQDTLAAAMRHACMLSGEPNDRFLKVLIFFEKVGVVSSIENWQLCRATLNLATHDYEIDHVGIAEHFNALNELMPELLSTAARLLTYCQDTLGIGVKANDFSVDFKIITQN